MGVQARGYPREQMSTLTLGHQHLVSADLNLENAASLLSSVSDGGLLIYPVLEHLSAYGESKCPAVVNA